MEDNSSYAFKKPAQPRSSKISRSRRIGLKQAESMVDARSSDAGNKVIDTIAAVASGQLLTRQERRFQWSVHEKRALLEALKVHRLDYAKLQRALPAKTIGDIKVFLDKVVVAETQNLEEIELDDLTVNTNRIQMCGRPRRVLYEEDDDEALLNPKFTHGALIDRWIAMIYSALRKREDFSELLADTINDLSEHSEKYVLRQQCEVAPGKHYVLNYSRIYDYLQAHLSKGKLPTLTVPECAIVELLLQQLASEIKRMDLTRQMDFIGGFVKNIFDRQIQQSLSSAEEGESCSDAQGSTMDEESDPQIDAISLNPIAIPMNLIECAAAPRLDTNQSNGCCSPNPT